MWWRGTHSRALLTITPCQAQDDVALLLESTMQELVDLEAKLMEEGLDSTEMYKRVLNDDTSQKVAQAFFVLYEMKCNSHALGISKEVLDRALSVDQAMRMLGHEASPPDPCTPLDPLSYWTTLTKSLSLMYRLKTVMQELQLGCKI